MNHFMKLNPQKNFFSYSILALALALAVQTTFAEVKLPVLFSDHMVLQSGERVPVWGWAKTNETVTVEIGTQKLVTGADAAGKWRVLLEPLPAGANLTLTVRGENTLTVQDVLVGEVWLGSGQSNMGLQVKEANQFEAEKVAANFPEIRMFTVAHAASPAAREECAGRWEVCHSNTVGNFSAALYFFGREIHQHLKVPVGLIHSSWGGTPIQPWMSGEALQTYPGYAALLERKQKEVAAWPEREQKITAELKAWELKAAEAKAANQSVPAKPWNPGPPDSGQYMPAQLYNAMIHPLIGYRLRGVLWYQGEANAGGGAAGASDYTDLQSRLIAGWREAWNLGDFPFYFAQLPNWNNDGDRSSNSWAFFREGQANILKVPNTGMALTIDIGDSGNIHPKKKQEAGRRLALLALAGVYHQAVISQGPQFWKHETNGAAIKLYFLHAAGGLVARGGPLKSFAVAGKDKQWHTAEARLDGDTVIVSSKEVPQPVAVRYGWANDPDCNLFNGADLPASPFRTDRW